MPASAPRDSTLAVVGDGFGSLIVYSTAIYLGFKPEEITIYGPSDNPVGTYQQFAYNLGQTVLRSESESHFLPADWPTFAELDAWSHRSLAPLVRSTKRKYNPGVSEILTEAGVVHKRLNWDGSRVPVRVGWLQREEDPAHFVLYDEDANFIGRSKHVMLALGHGPLSFPPTLAKAKAADPEIDDRIVQAYEAKSTPRRALHRARRGHRLHQRMGQRARRRRQVHRPAPQPGARRAGPQRAALPLRGAGHRHLPGLPFEQRVQFLGNVLKGTTPRRRSWLREDREGAQRPLQPLRGSAGPADQVAAGESSSKSAMHGRSPPPCATWWSSRS